MAMLDIVKLVIANLPNNTVTRLKTYTLPENTNNSSQERMQKKNREKLI